MPIQSCGQSVSAPRGKADARLNAHTELRAKRQRSAREAIYRNRPIKRLKLKSDEMLSSFAYNFILRHYKAGQSAGVRLKLIDFVGSVQRLAW